MSAARTACRIDRPGDRVDIHEDRTRPRVCDRVGRGDHREGRDDHLVARTYVERRKRSEMQRRGPARRGHATSGADPGAEQLLKLADIGAEVTDVPAGGGITDRPVPSTEPGFSYLDDVVHVSGPARA